MLQLVVPGIAALVGAFIGALLTLAVARMHIRADHSARVWEARKAGYTAILRKLKDASRKADVVDDGYNSGEDGRGPHDYHSSPYRQEQEHAAGKAWGSCKEAYDAECLILSNGFRDRFDLLLRSLPTMHDQYDPPEDARNFAACLREGHRGACRSPATRRVPNQPSRPPRIARGPFPHPDRRAGPFTTATGPRCRARMQRPFIPRGSSRCRATSKVSGHPSTVRSSACCTHRNAAL